jgi:hypothetical protein
VVPKNMATTKTMLVISRVKFDMQEQAKTTRNKDEAKITIGTSKSNTRTSKNHIYA